MKSEFEKWLGDVWLSDAEWDESKNTYSDSRIHCMWSAWQHQQTKIDELQKRLDAAQKLIDDWNFGGVHIFDLLDELEQALKGGSTPNLNTDENGECRHFSTTMFADGKAECFQCDAVVNEQREVIGKQSKDLHPFFKREPK